MASYSGSSSSFDTSYPSSGRTSDVPSFGRNTSLSPYDIDPKYLPANPEFIFPIEQQQNSYGTKLFDAVGTSYLGGLSVGGVWGFVEGVRKAGGMSRKLYWNTILNGCTKRGPFLGNTLGVLAVLYASWEHVLCKVTKKEDSVVNKMAAATLTGAIFKSTAGVRSLAIAASLGAAVSGSYFVVMYMTGRGRMGTFGRKSSIYS